MGIPCKVTPKRGIAKALGLQENATMSYSEWVDALSNAEKKGDIVVDKNGNIEFSEKATAEIKKANLLTSLNSHMGAGKETKVYTSENLEEIDSSGFNDVQKKVIGDIEKIIKAVDKLVKNVTGNKLSVHVHASEAEYVKAIVNAGGTEADAKSRGFYLDSDGTIHLNMNRLTSETLLHEGIHPILDYLAVNNSKVINSLYKQLRGIDGGQEFAKKAAKLYKGKGALTIKKEALTDFIANIADGTFELTKSNFEKAKEFIYDLLNTIGIKIPAKYSDIRDIESLQDLAKFISQSFAKGEEIKSVDVTDKANLGGEDKAKGMMSFSKTDYGKSKVSKEPALDKEEYDKAFTDKIMPDGTPRIQVVNPKESLKDKTLMQTFPDDHFVGSLKYNGVEIAYGNGGFFYAAKYGEKGGVWSSVTQQTANSFANNINAARKLNKGEATILLTKGEDLKLQTSLESVTGLISTLLTVAESNGKEGYDSIVNVVKQLYNIHGNTKTAKAVKMYFDEYLTGGRAESGQTMSSAKDHFSSMMTKLTTQSNAAVTEVLRSMGFDGVKYFDATRLKKGEYKVTKKGLENFFIDIFAEDVLSGAKAGDVYGAIKVYSDVKVAPKDNAHPSYPYPLVTVDGSPVKVEIFDRTFPAYGENVALKGRVSKSKAAYGSASFTTPIYTIDPSKISDVPTRTEKIEQYESVKRTQKPAVENVEVIDKKSQYYKDAKELISSNVNTYGKPRLVIVEKGKVVAALSLEDSDFEYKADLAVIKAERNKGLSKKLIDGMIRDFVKGDWEQIRLEVTNKNLLNNLTKNFGFESEWNKDAGADYAYMSKKQAEAYVKNNSEPAEQSLKETPQAEKGKAKPSTKGKIQASRVEETTEALKGKDVSSVSGEIDIEQTISTEELNEIPRGETFQERLAPEYFEDLKKDIKKNGIKQPLIIKYYVKDNAVRLMEGHHRLKIAKELGIKDVPVQVNVVWGRSIEEGNEDIKDKPIVNPPTPINKEKYTKRDYAPSNIKIEELGYKNKEISEAYHKAKEDGSNPELVEAVEKITGKPSTKGKIQASRVENDKVADTYVEPHMTESEDGKDYVFFHVSSADKAMLSKGIDSRKFYSMRTSSQEKSSQYGVASFYTKPEDAESMVSGNKYVVRVPKDKVYPMDLDPNKYKERAEEIIPKNAPFRSANIKKKMAEMAVNDGYRMAVGEWRFDRKGETIPENEFRADALIPLRPTKETPDSYESNLSKGMERVAHPDQEQYLRGKQLEDLAEKVYSHYSSKNKYGEAYQIANNIRVYGGIMEGLNTPNERVRPLTKEEFDTMTNGLPKELAAVADNIKFSKEEDSVNETMKDWVISQFEAGVGESDLVDVLKDYGLSDKEAADTVAAAVESLNEPTKAEKNKQRADAVNPFLNYTPDETGVQNMVATLERIQAGKDPIEIDPETKRDWKTVMQRAKDFFLNPNNSVDNLIQDLRDGKAPTAEDVAVMTMHKVKLDNDMAEALEQRAKLIAEGNPNFLIQDAKISEISSRLEEYYEAARRSSYEQGLAFGIRKMMLANDYSIGTLLRRVKATGDTETPKAVVKQLETLSTRVKEQAEEITRLEGELAKEKAQQTLDTIINNVKPPKVNEEKTPEKNRIEKAIKAIEGIRAKIKNRSYSDATLIVAAVDSGLMAIEKALKAGLSVSRAIEKGVKAINKAMKGAKWDEEAFRKDVTEGFISEGVDINKTEISDLEIKDNKLEINRGYLETLVENGYDTIDKMVDFIKGTEAGEKFTEREIMDAISGYGETEYPPADKVSEKISIAKGEGKALAALADVISGMLPKKSGFQRRKRTDRERRLLQETRQKLKAFPEDAEKSAKSWASALDRVKSSYKNRIADLDKAIKEGKKIFKEKRNIELDKEAKDLKDQKEALQSIYDKKFAPDIKSSIEKLAERAAELTNDINKAKKNNDPDAERRAKIEKELTEGVINDLKAAAKANRSEQEVKLEQIKKSLKAQIETLNKKIDGTYEEKVKIDVTLDEETIDLMEEREQLKEMLASTTNRNETDAERAERLTEYYEKQVAQLEADIANMNIGYRVKSTVSPTPEMQRVKDKLNDLVEMRKMLREQLGLAYLRDVKLAEKRNERMLKALEQKKQAVINGTYKPKLKKASPTSNLIEIQRKTKAALEGEIEQIIAERERANRSKFKKIVDSTSEVFRASVLSGVATVEKLTGYGLMETLFVHPIQGMVVGQVTRYIPYISRINKMAGGRMTLGFGKEAKITAKAYAEFFSKDTWKDTANIVKTGKSELDLLWGEYKVAHPEIGAWVGHLHKALKNPTLRASFVRHMEGNLVYQVEVLGMDSSDPATIAAASRASLIDAYSDILLNKNWVSSAWNSMIRGAELMGKKDNAYLKNTGIFFAGVLKILEPVTGVPMNAANRLASYYPPMGLARALGGIIVNRAEGKKPEDMTKEEAANIIRNIKAAGTGAIGYAIGYMFASLFGGSDDDDEIKNKSGLKKGEFAFMSKHLGHHPLWEIMQIGATDKRIDDNGEDTSSKKLLNYVHIQYEYVENTPFFDFPLSVKEAVTEEGGGSRVIGGVLRSLTTPMLVQQLSKYMDTDSEGNPINRQRDGFLDEMKYGLYPFRKDLPVKGGLMIKEDHRKYFEDINFRPSLDKKSSDKFTLKGKQVMTDDEYSQYTSRVDSDFNSFLTENIDNLKYRTYTSEEQKEMNKDLVEPMNPAEINIEFEKKKKDMLSRAKSAIDSKYTAEYRFNKNIITKSVYDSEIKSSKTELENIVDFINNNYKNKEKRKKREKREKKRK